MAAVAFSGCAAPQPGPVVFYCEGAGWYTSAASVERGLRAAGYMGRFENYSWTSHLGAGADHFITARSSLTARGLARKIERQRKADAKGQIVVMGLSAGTMVVVSALERLPKEVMVDDVVLFAPSISSRHDLTRAMRHVRNRLYATTSPHDGILKTLAVNADGLSGRPAGRAGFVLPPSPDAASRALYKRVVNLPWRPGYIAYDNHGGHTEATEAAFVKAAISPRVFRAGAYPLDRSVAKRSAAGL